jgi:cytochrome d ubiquinol oxidase subunit II
MGIDLPLIWAIIIGFGLMMYVIMDGFDLGIGILFPFVQERHDRDTMVNTVAPVWDGNETWLVLGAAALLAAFPIAYAVILSALYLPLVLMLGGLTGEALHLSFDLKRTRRTSPSGIRHLQAAPTSRPSHKASLSALSLMVSR